MYLKQEKKGNCQNQKKVLLITLLAQSKSTVGDIWLTCETEPSIIHTRECFCIFSVLIQRFPPRAAPLDAGGDAYIRRDQVHPTPQSWPSVGHDVKADSNSNKPNSQLYQKQVYVTMVTTSKYVIGAEVLIFTVRVNMAEPLMYFAILVRCLQSVFVRSIQPESFLP